jgi:hypothetical protein
MPTITPHPTIIVESYSNTFPLDWGLAPLSEEQEKQVMECDVEKLAKEKYPEQYKIDELSNLFEPSTGCEWATLAYAYTLRLSDGEEIPEIAKNAFGKAITDNPGYAFSSPLFYWYFYDSFIIVKQPQLFDQQITKVKIEYQWDGMGDPVKYTIDIRQADTNPSVVVSNYESASLAQNLKTKLNKDLVQALGKSLTNLLPIRSQFSLVTCTDSNPDWTITITLKDGTVIVLKTNGSNMINIGGPWQTNIDGQNYMQYSIDFVKAVHNIIQEIGLTYGEPRGMFCHPVNVLDLAYP